MRLPWFSTSWKIFLIDRKLLSSVNNTIRRLVSTWIGTHVHVYLKDSCNFKATSANRRQLSGELSSLVYLEKVLRSLTASLGEFCNHRSKVKCMVIKRVSLISEVNRTNAWWTFLIGRGCFVFKTPFAYIGSTVVCLFAATEDTHEEFRQITVEGLHRVTHGTKVHYACCYLSPAISGSSYFL